MKLKDIIARLSPSARPDFIAPITPPTKDIYTKVGDVPFVYGRSPSLPNDWFKFHWDGAKIAPLGERPQPGEIDSYMALLRPRWLLIVIHRMKGQSWLCYPYNWGDAQQKGWGYNPVAVHLVTDTIEPFDLIYARGQVGNLIYWHHAGSLPDKQYMIAGLNAPADIFAPSDSRELVTAYRIARQRIVEENIKRAEEARMDQMRILEGRIRHHIEFLGSELVSWHESGNDIVVTWKDGPIFRSARIDNSVQTTVAGICLAGGDRTFNLAALVDVYREAARRNRPGAGGTHEPRHWDDYEDDYDD